MLNDDYRINQRKIRVASGYHEKQFHDLKQIKKNPLLPLFQENGEMSKEMMKENNK